VKICDIANIVGGIVTGDKDFDVKGIGKIESAINSDITFISNPVYAKFFSTTKAGAIIVAEDFETPDTRKG